MMIRNLTPVNDLQHFGDLMDRLLGSVDSNATSGQALPLDVFELEDKFVVRASVPGIRPEDVSVTVENRVLTIAGEYKADVNFANARVFRLENRFGSVTRSLKLPANLDLENVDAEFNHGIVTIRIPRIEDKKAIPVRVPIRTAQDGEGTN